MSKGIIGIYCRVSSDSQKDGYSLDTQSEDGRKWCDENGYSNEVFVDVISGKTTKREGFDRLQTKLYSGEIIGIFVRDFNRLIRGSEIEFFFSKIVDDTKCIVVEGGKQIDLINSLSDNTYFLMKSMLGKVNRNEIHFNSRRGIIESLKKGKVRGKTKFGYDKKDGIPSLNKEESIIVKDVFKCFLYKSTTDMKSFSKKMNEKHNLNISDVNYKRFLQYEGYVGKLTQKYMELSFETEIPQIIDKEVFDKVIHKLNSWKRKRKGRDTHNYLLKGMVFCGNCGDRMYKRGSKGKSGLYHYYYVCKNYGSRGYKNHYITDEEWELKKCKGFKGNTINFGLVDELVWEFLFKFLNDSNSVKEEYKKKFIQNKVEVNKVKSKERYYQKKISEVEKKKFTTYNQHLDGKLSLENFNQFDRMFNEEINQIKDRIHSLKETEIEFDDSEMLSDFLEYLKSELNNLYSISKSNFNDRKRVIDKYIDTLEIRRINDKEYDINCNFVLDLEIETKEMNPTQNVSLRGSNFYIKNTISSYSNSYIGTILWKQRFNVKHLIKYIPNQKSLYRLVIERLEFEILKRK